MKISKLFHWLYAVLMLLPVFAIGSSLLISTFNMQSKQQYEYHYLYETNDVDNYTYNLIEGNVYHIDFYNGSFDEVFPNLDLCRLRFYNIERFDIGSFDEPFIDEIIYNNNIFNASSPFLDMVIYGDDSSMYLGFGTNLNADDYLIGIETGIPSYSTAFILTGDFILYEIDIDLSSTTSIPIDYVTCTENIPFDSIDLHNVSSKDVFYNAVEEVTNNSLFSWAYNSFLATPILFITGLFSIPSVSVINQLLSYWLAISVIWLVFDLIMYVPLLVHRWIDKGMLE